MKPSPDLLTPDNHALILIDYQDQIAFATKSISISELRVNESERINNNSISTHIHCFFGSCNVHGHHHNEARLSNIPVHNYTAFRGALIVHVLLLKLLMIYTCKTTMQLLTCVLFFFNFEFINHS